VAGERREQDERVDEERDAEEIVAGFGRRTAPEGVATYNPAFDITPAEYISAIITERGIARPPLAGCLAGLLGATAPG